MMDLKIMISMFSDLKDPQQLAEALAIIATHVRDPANGLIAGIRLVSLLDSDSKGKIRGVVERILAGEDAMSVLRNSYDFPEWVYEGITKKAKELGVL